MERRQHRGLEIGHLAFRVGYIIPKRVANSFAAGLLMHDVTDSPLNFVHRVGTAKNQK